MAKIIHFPDNRPKFDSATDFLNDSIKVLEDEKVESVLIAGRSKDGYVVTGYHKCDFGLRQELCGHIQCDIIDQMIRENPERYIDED